MAREPHRSSEILDAVALLVVDMQDAFLNVMPDREAVLRRTALAIESARTFGIKVIFTEQVPNKLGPTHAALRSLAPEARVFAKTEFSALLADGLHEYLRRINVYHLLLAGIETPICVYQTALHAQDNELDVTILSDCTTGRRPEDCYVVLESLARAECHVLPAETVFYSMLGSSLNPRFPHFTRIVKRYAGDGTVDGIPTPAPEPEPRPEGEERHGGQRHGDRQRGGRHGDRHHERRQQASPADERPEEAAEPTDDLRAEDGISDEEANQPSYEEATADHSEGEEPTAPVAESAPSQPAAADESDAESSEDEGEPAADDESADGDSATESADGAPKKKRGRRRRGGARRRRARERAAAANGQPATDAGGPAAETSAPAEGGSPDSTPDAPPAS